jgi:molybdopterin converting factor small subunit
VPVLRLFARARQEAGVGEVLVPGATVEEVLAAARDRFGPGFVDVLEHSAVWLNGEPASPGQAVGADDEVAVLPPVSGGT